jgi:hypothetical protein
MFVVIGCTDTQDPTAPAGVDVAGPSLAALPPGWTEFNWTTFDGCNGEFVDFETRRAQRIEVKSDANGGFHFSFHRTWIGTGVGRDTGTEYVFNWPGEWQEYVGGPFPETFTRMLANNLVSKRGAENRIFRGLIHYTVNANGDITSDVSNLTLECVG